MKRCKYCGKQIEDSFEFCKSKCKENYKKAGECDSRKMKYFISGMALGFLVLFCGVCAGSNTIMGTGIVLMGITVILLPFTTPETNALLGYQRARTAGRALGILLLIAGIFTGIK